MEGNCKINTDFNLVGMFPAGLNSEGLYRVSGFSDLIEDVKMAFDRGMFFPCAAILNRHSLSVQPSPASCSAVPAVRGSGGLCRQKGGGGGGSAPSEMHIRFSSVFITESALLLPSVSVLQ